MSNSGKYSLLFTGLKDQDPTTLRKVKTVFVTDLELPIPEIQDILDHPPRCILSADQKNDLKTLLKSLKSAGALVEVVENSIPEEKQAAPAEEEDEFSFEIDLSELAEQKKPKNTKVWQLSFDQDDEEEPSLLDLPPPKPPSSISTVPDDGKKDAQETADTLEINPAENNATLKFETLESSPGEVWSPAPEEELTLNLEASSEQLDLESGLTGTRSVEEPRLALEVSPPSAEDELSPELEDSAPFELSPDPLVEPQTADPLDLMLMSLDEDDEQDSSPSARTRPKPEYDLHIQDPSDEDDDSAEVPNESELDLLLIDMDEEDEEEMLSAPSPAPNTPSVRGTGADTEPYLNQADDNSFDLAFDEVDSDQCSEGSPGAPPPDQSESTVLNNFAKTLDDLLPHLESQKETFLATPQPALAPDDDTADLTLGDFDTESAVDIDISEPVTTAAPPVATPEPEQPAPSEEQTADAEEEETPKRKAKPLFISTAQSKPTSDGEPSSLALNETIADDEDGPTIAYLNTQTRLSRQAEQRKEAIRYSILYGIICLAIFIGGNWILFSFVLNNSEERSPMIAPVTDADIKQVKIETTEEPETPLNPDLALIKETVSKELILQSKSPTFSLKAACGASDQGLVRCKISGEGIESQMPSKKDRANGIKQPPWLTRLESDEIIFNLVKKDESRIAEGTANAYIMYDRLSNRITANVTLRTSPPPSEDALKKETRKLTVEIYAQKEVPATEGLEVSLTENRQFALAARASFDF